MSGPLSEQDQNDTSNVTADTSPPSALPSQDLDDESPAETDNEASDAPEESDQSENGESDEAENQPEQMADVETSPVANGNSAGTIDVIGNKPPAQNALQGYAQDMAFNQDLAGGKIVPETYHDLYAKKDTLGKIGTLFGLLLSGAGSGLAHQPNAMMDMMNQEINRDLQSQQTNQSNKLNWFNSALAHEKNQSEIQLNQAQEDLARAGTQGSSLSNELENWKNSTLPGMQRLGATTTAQNSMIMASIQHQQDAINRLAPGPQKDAAQLALDNQIRPAANQQMMKNRTELANRINAIHQISPNPLAKLVSYGDQQNPTTTLSADPRAPVADMDTYRKRTILGRIAPQAPGAIPPAEIPAIDQEIKNISLNRANAADAADSFQKLQALKLAGQVPFKNATQALGAVAGAGLGAALGPEAAAAGSYLGQIVGKTGTEAANIFERQRNIEKEALSNRVGRGLSDDAREKLVDSMLPSWVDNDATSQEAWRKMQQHFSSQEFHQNPRMENYELNTPFPEQPYVPTDQLRKNRGNNQNSGPSFTQPGSQEVDWNQVNNNMAQ